MLNIIVLLITIDKFDPNLVFVNINKLKPYNFIKNRTPQPILTNPSDLVIDEPVQTKEPELIPIENANFEFIEFESVNNYLTHGNIIGTYIHVYYHNDVHVEFNYVLDCNNQNNTFNGKPIDDYTLEVYNLKSRIYSWSHGCYQLESYKELPHPLSCIFVFFLATRGHE